MSLAEAFRHQDLHWAAKQLLTLVAEQRHRLLVHQDNCSGRIDDNHGVRQRLEQGTKDWLGPGRSGTVQSLRGNARLGTRLRGPGRLRHGKLCNDVISGAFVGPRQLLQHGHGFLIGGGVDLVILVHRWAFRLEDNIFEQQANGRKHPYASSYSISGN